jgi:hypothetical protein
MDEQRFWELVESSKAAASGSFDLQAKELVAQLARLPAEEILAFDRIRQEKMVSAYSWDLWGAAYVINGGCSDDGFTDFRSWLISRGRDRYERALRDAESLADVEPGPDGDAEASFESFGYVAAKAYEQKTGQRKPVQPITHPRTPSGEPWEEDHEELAARFPRLFARFVK